MVLTDNYNYDYNINRNRKVVHIIAWNQAFQHYILDVETNNCVLVEDNIAKIISKDILNNYINDCKCQKTYLKKDKKIRSIGNW